MTTRRSPAGFTLVEMLTVMLIIAIIASMVVGIATYVNKKSALTRADGEVKAISVACESYKSDYGVYPRAPGATEDPDEGAAPPAGVQGRPVDPRVDGNPQDYVAGSRYLYQQLSGDNDRDGKPGDTTGTTTARMYMEFKPGMLKSTGTGASLIVSHIIDPFGWSYGYSTQAAKQEDAYRQAAQDAKAGETPERTKTPKGYNPTFDLWSTAGYVRTGSTPPSDLDRNRWVKNW